MRGLLRYSAYLPYRRLDRSQITEVVGSGGGRGTRTVASFDEDTTTMAVEAGRLALGELPRDHIDGLWFSTSRPAYGEKTNATAIHAALRLSSAATALDVGNAVRSGVAGLRAALGSNGTTLCIASDIRVGLAGGADESAGGDGAAALLVGDESDDAPVLAEYLGGASAIEEFVDRWRAPGAVETRRWEERFAETRLIPLAQQALAEALTAANLDATALDHVVITGTNARAVKRSAGKLGLSNVASDLTDVIGNTGTAHPGLLLASQLDQAEPGETIAVIALADGAEVLIFRATEALVGHRATRSVAAQIEAGAAVSYGKYLHWRGLLTVQPPNRPEPARVSSSAAVRSNDWKYGFVGSKGAESGTIHLPPTDVSLDPADTGLTPVEMADVQATVVTFTVDRLVYSVSPPVVFVVVDFDGGGRMPVELTDVSQDEVEIGMRVEMTFRRLYTADGIHNYFWKARPIR